MRMVYKSHRLLPRISVVIAAFVGLLLVMPTIAVVPISFSSKSSFELPPAGWSLRFYRQLLQEPLWRDALFRSLWISAIVAIAATVLGWLAADYLIARSTRTARVIEGVLLLPVVVPIIISAVAIYSMFLRWDIVGTNLGFFLADLVIVSPLAVVTMSTGLRKYDATLERAAESLGAGLLARIILIRLPLLLPSVLSSLVMCFVVGFDETVIARYIQSPTVNTLPVVMYSSVQADIDPTIAAAATFVIAVGTVLLTATWAARTKLTGAAK
jgi:putative spermidine/putrescine transport system permease protein